MSLTIRFEIIDEAEEEPAIDLLLSMAGNSRPQEVHDAPLRDPRDGGEAAGAGARRDRGPPSSLPRTRRRHLHP